MMQPTRSLMQRKKNLLIAFDAFGTLFHPRVSVAEQYRALSREHGINLPTEVSKINAAFGDAWKSESTEHPNFGKAAGIGPEKWWGNVITKTLNPFLTRGQTIPSPLIAQLYQQFSSNRGYALYPDVPTFFNLSNSQTPAGKWEKIIIGVITNSDNRVPSVLESLGLSVGPRRAGTQAQQQIETKEDHDIDFVVLSYDVEAAKPDRKIFDAGVDMLREVLTAEAEKREALAAEIEEEKLKYVEKESERLNEYIRDNDVEKAAKHLESLIRMSRTPPLEPRLSVDDFEKLYVGDEIEKDYLGAERAGWNALYLKRPERADGGLFEPQSDGIEEMDKRVRDENGNVVTKKIRFITHLEQLQHWHP